MTTDPASRTFLSDEVNRYTGGSKVIGTQRTHELCLSPHYRVDRNDTMFPTRFRTR